MRAEVEVRRFPAEWVEALTPEELERLAIRTVDGTMSDGEALVAEGLSKKLWVWRAAAAKRERAEHAD